MCFSLWLFNFEKKLERNNRSSTRDKGLSVGARQEGVSAFIAGTRGVQENTGLQERAGVSVTEKPREGKAKDGLCATCISFSMSVFFFFFFFDRSFLGFLWITVNEW